MQETKVIKSKSSQSFLEWVFEGGVSQEAPIRPFPDQLIPVQAHHTLSTCGVVRSSSSAPSLGGLRQWSGREAHSCCNQVSRLPMRISLLFFLACGAFATAAQVP